MNDWAEKIDTDLDAKSKHVIDFHTEIADLRKRIAALENKQPPAA